MRKCGAGPYKAGAAQGLKGLMRLAELRKHLKKLGFKTIVFYRENKPVKNKGFKTMLL